MSWLKSRFTEPSTWAGLAGLIPMVATAAAGGLTPDTIGGIVAGVAAVFMKEQGKA